MLTRSRKIERRMPEESYQAWPNSDSPQIARLMQIGDKGFNWYISNRIREYVSAKIIEIFLNCYGEIELGEWSIHHSRALTLSTAREDLLSGVDAILSESTALYSGEFLAIDFTESIDSFYRKLVKTKNRVTIERSGSMLHIQRGILYIDPDMIQASIEMVNHPLVWFEQSDVDDLIKYWAFSYLHAADTHKKIFFYGIPRETNFLWEFPQTVIDHLFRNMDTVRKALDFLSSSIPSPR